MSGLFHWLRKIVAGAILVGVAAAGIWLAYRIFIRPQLTVSGPSGSTAIITALSTNASERLKIITPASVTVDPGAYRIAIMGSNGSGAVYYETVSLLQRIGHTLGAQTPQTANLIGNHAAYSIVDSGGTLVYLDTTSHTLERLNGDGTVIPIGNPGQAQMICPVANGDAVVLMHNNLFALHNGMLSPLDTNGYPNVAATITIGTNALQPSFVIAADKALYYYSSITAQPQGVLTLPKIADRLILGGNNVIAYSTRMPDAVEDIRQAYNAYAIDPLLINISAKTNRTLASGPIAGASISPDGKLATIEPRRSQTTNIYNTDTNQLFYRILNPDGPLVWTSDTSLAYTDGENVWSFDVVGRNGTLVSTIGQGTEITSLTYDAVRGYFVTVYDGPEQAYIYNIPAGSGAS